MTNQTNWFSCHQSFDEEFNFLPFFINSEGYRYALETHEGEIISSEKEGLEYYEQHGLPYVRPGRSTGESERGSNTSTRPNTERMAGKCSTIDVDSGKRTTT